MRASENPFRVSKQESFLFEFPENDNWDACLSRLNKLGGRTGVIGAKGLGKTTFLLELKARLEQDNFEVDYLFLNCEKRRFSASENVRLCEPMHAQRFIILDGAEQLNFWQFRRFNQKTARAGGLVISTHKQQRLPILLKVDRSFLRFQQFVNSLLVGFPKLKYLSETPCLASIFANFNGNIREALRELYRLAEQSDL